MSVYISFLADPLMYMDVSFNASPDSINDTSDFSADDKGNYIEIKKKNYIFNSLPATFNIYMQIKEEYANTYKVDGYAINILPKQHETDFIQTLNSDVITLRASVYYDSAYHALTDAEISPSVTAYFGTQLNSEIITNKNVRLTSGASLFIDEEGSPIGGKAAYSIGQSSRAIADYSFANGLHSFAVAKYSHAEGSGSQANGEFSHAEGLKTVSIGEASHSEGQVCKANKNYSHAEGSYSIANGIYSHAEGENTVTTGRSSHAEGLRTTSENAYSHAEGKYNKPMTSGASESNKIGDAFVIGNGTSSNGETSNAFRVTFSGQTYMTGTANTEGADYAEFFEWQDGNPDAEDRVGRFVTLDGEFIHYASQGDYILGIVSGNPAVVGNSDEDYKHRWLKDDFGRLVREYLEPSEQLIDTADMLDDDLESLRHDPDIEEREGAFYRKTEVPTDHVTESWRYKASPDYDPDKPYTERKDRPEWDYVGMLGVLPVYDDGTCEVNGYCQCGENGIATRASMAIAGQSFRVIKRIGPNIVKVVFR